MLLLILITISCSENGKTEPAPLGTGADSLRVLLGRLMEFDSTNKSRINSYNDLALDSVVRIEIMSHVEIIPTEQLEEMALLYSRHAGKGELQSAHVNEWLGEVRVRNGEFDKATELFEEALGMYRSIKDSTAMGRVNNWLGAITSYQGDYLGASQFHYNALNIYESLKDSSGVISSLREIGGAFLLQQKYNEAIELFMIALRYHERQKDTIGIAVMYSSLGDAYHQTGKYEESRVAMQKALDLYVQTGYETGIAEGYNNLAISAMSNGEFDLAKTWLQNALDLGDSIGDIRQRPVVMYNLGICFMETGKPAIARQWFLYSLDEATKQKQSGEVVLRNYVKLAELDEREGDFKHALAFNRKYSNLKDSLYSIENAKAIEELKLKYQTGRKELELAKVQQEKESSQRRVTTLSFALGIIIIFIAAFTWFFTDRTKRNRKLSKIESELRNRELETVKQELEFNRIQLSDFTMHLKDKSQQIILLEEQLSKGTQPPVNSISSVENEENPESIYGIKILTDEDWSRFKKYFDKVFPGMIQRLRDLRPDITSAEQRLFMLIRLNTESREIADMLGISPDSVRKTKYRLKKKLQLTEDNSLDEFIRNF